LLSRSELAAELNLTETMTRRLELAKLDLAKLWLRSSAESGDPHLQIAVLQLFDEELKQILTFLRLRGSNKKVRNIAKRTADLLGR